MRLKSFRIQNYRSILDSGIVEVEDTRTILVGPNEAGKSALLKALQQINPPNETKILKPLRDYPRRLYSSIRKKEVDPKHVVVVQATFSLEDEEIKQLPNELRMSDYVCTRFLDGGFEHHFEGVPPSPNFGAVKLDIERLSIFVDEKVSAAGMPESENASTRIKEMNLSDDSSLTGMNGKDLNEWLDIASRYFDENSSIEKQYLQNIKERIAEASARANVLELVRSFLPVFVYYNNYFRVRPVLHLKNFAQRLESNDLDDDQHDYGNLCLLNMLGFEANELSALGDVSDASADNAIGFEEFREKLDERSYELNAAENKLSDEVRRVWNPDTSKGETATLRITADGQYLKVSVEDELGVNVELDQRSEGLQWLISFFIVFFSESQNKHRNAILLLDEPGLSLHGLKQREFRKTIERLSINNQTLFTTHSPFMVGPDELDRVRVVEMVDRKVGTKVHQTINAKDPSALLPLQEALGYDLAQSLFTQQRNLILEGITDLWYIEATAFLLRSSGLADLHSKISLVPAAGAGKVVYYATILHAQNLKVAALLDSDSAGNVAARQDALIDILSNKKILRTRDFGADTIKNCQIEDLLRSTLTTIVAADYNTDISELVKQQPNRSIVEIILDKKIPHIKFKLAKSYVRWCRDHSATDLAEQEQESWVALINRVNSVLK